jgi:hypothetical protein
MLRRDLDVDVELVEGRYGEFSVLVDGQTLLEGGVWTFLGIMPSLARVRAVVERARNSAATGDS